MQFDSDIYGDAIHLARSMASTFDNTKYDDYDDCLQPPIAPRSSGASALQVHAYPNPSTGVTQLDFGRQFTGQLMVVNTAGKVVFEMSLEKINGVELNITAGAGLYIIQTADEAGYKTITKLVVTK